MKKLYHRVTVCIGVISAESSEITIGMVLKDHSPARDVALSDPGFPEESHYTIVGCQLRNSLFSEEPLEQAVRHLLGIGGDWNLDQHALLRSIYVDEACQV